MSDREIVSPAIHGRANEISCQEALEIEVARRKSWVARPDVIEWKQRRQVAGEMRAREKAAKRKKPELIGPPNPFRTKLRP